MASVTGPLQPCSFKPLRHASTPFVRIDCSSLIALISVSFFSRYKRQLWKANTGAKMTPSAVITDAIVIIVCAKSISPPNLTT